VPWLFVAIAIAAELTGTLGLRQLGNSVSWWSVVIIVLAYVTSFASLGLALRNLNVGIVYALWSGIGTAAVSAAGALVFGERLGWQAIVGMSLIVVGVCVLLSSGTMHHNPTQAEPSRSRDRAAGQVAGSACAVVDSERTCADLADYRQMN
jgi:small multidrug resistance pump